MRPEIINKNRYKKITKKEARQKKKNTKNISMNNKKGKNRYKNNNKFLKIILLISCVILISFISKKIDSIDKIPMINVFFNSDDSKLQKDYNFKIGLTDIGNISVGNTKNIILNEALFSCNLNLLRINEDYSVSYEVIKNIIKLSLLEYSLELDPNYKITAEYLREFLSSITEDNVYYKNIKNIASMEVISEYVINFKLKEEDIYFIYNLQIPIFNKNNSLTPYTSKIDTNNMSMTRTSNSKSSLLNVTISNYQDINALINDFRNKNVDMFVASSESVMKLIGKHEYNIRKYRDGQCIFLFGNKNSKLFNKLEVRGYLTYGMDRNSIINDVNPSFCELIDIPYIYSNVRYKYDIYAATNMLLSNGWKKNINNIFEKSIDGKLTQLNLNMIVNKDDSIKLQIGQKISEIFSKIGANITVIPLSSEDMVNVINSGQGYDILLADVNIGYSPDISFLYQFININDNISKAIDELNFCSLQNISTNIMKLQDAISSQMACIGIMARNTNIVYQKYISGIGDISYMKIFDNFENIGRLKED